ncbi:hypothetical protein VPH35_107737 [Triticum aestivum]
MAILNSDTRTIVYTMAVALLVVMMMSSSLPSCHGTDEEEGWECRQLLHCTAPGCLSYCKVLKHGEGHAYSIMSKCRHNRTECCCRDYNQPPPPPRDLVLVQNNAGA